MPSSSRGNRGRGSRTTALVALICILLVLIGIVIYLIVSPSTINTVGTTTITEPVTEEILHEIIPEKEEEPIELVIVQDLPTETIPNIEELSVEEETILEEVIEVPEDSNPMEAMEPIALEEEQPAEALEEVVEDFTLEREDSVTETGEETEFAEEEIPSVTIDEAFLDSEEVKLEETSDTIILEINEVVEELEEVVPEIVAPPVPILKPETIQTGLMEVLSRMNLDPIPTVEGNGAQEEAVEETVALEDETAVVEEMEMESAESESLESEPIEEVLVLPYEETVIPEEEPVASYSFAKMMDGAVIEAQEASVIVKGRAGQAVLSLSNGYVHDVGKENKLKFVDVYSDEGKIIHYVGFERVSVKKGQELTEGTVIGSVGSSSMRASIQVTVFDSNHQALRIDI